MAKLSSTKMVPRVPTSSTLQARALARASRPRPWATKPTAARQQPASKPSTSAAPVVPKPAPVTTRPSRLPMMRASAAIMSQIALSRPVNIAALLAKSQAIQGSRTGGQPTTSIPMLRSSSPTLSQVRRNGFATSKPPTSVLLSSLEGAHLLGATTTSEKKDESDASTTATFDSNDTESTKGTQGSSSGSLQGRSKEFKPPFGPMPKGWTWDGREEVVDPEGPDATEPARNKEEEEGMYLKRKRLTFSKFAEEDRMAIEAWVDVDDESFLSHHPPASDCVEQTSTIPGPSELAGPPDEEASDLWSETDMEENERERMALNAWDNMVRDRMRTKELLIKWRVPLPPNAIIESWTDAWRDQERLKELVLEFSPKSNLCPTNGSQNGNQRNGELAFISAPIYFHQANGESTQEWLNKWSEEPRPSASTSAPARFPLHNGGSKKEWLNKWSEEPRS